jgi:hypothetical protein
MRNKFARDRFTSAKPHHHDDSYASRTHGGKGIVQALTSLAGQYQKP